MHICLTIRILLPNLAGDVGHATNEATTATQGVSDLVHPCGAVATTVDRCAVVGLEGGVW